MVVRRNDISDIQRRKYVWFGLLGFLVIVQYLLGTIAILDSYLTVPSIRKNSNDENRIAPRVVFMLESFPVSPPEPKSTILRTMTQPLPVDRVSGPRGKPPRMEMPEAAPMDAEIKVSERYISEREWYEDCVPTTEHERQFRPTCNVFHELDLPERYDSVRSENTDNNHATTAGQRKNSIELLGMGVWRSAWNLTTTGSMAGHSKTSKHAFDGIGLALKLLHFHHDFSERNFIYHQIDAMVMERLTRSEYVVDSFGFCGESVITEATIETEISPIIISKTLPPIERLRLASDLARGLADLHALTGYSWERRSSSSNSNNNINSSSIINNRADPSHPLPLIFSHQDVKPSNLIIARNGKMKWNDFNSGRMNRKYANNATACPFPFRNRKYIWKSDTECKSSIIFRNTERPDQNTARPDQNTAGQAADVYSMGKLLYYFLTKKAPPPTDQQTCTTSTQLPDMLLKVGLLPEEKKIFEAVKLCYSDQGLRPSAREVAEFLESAHAELLRSEPGTSMPSN
jgi:hypothetical protein